MRYLTVGGAVLGALASLLTIISFVYQAHTEAPTARVVRDGNFVVRMHSFAKAGLLAQRWVHTRPEGQLWVLSVVVENRGRTAAAAAPRFTVVAGHYRFPAVRWRGRAFDYMILPDGSASGTLAFDVGEGLVPEFLEVDADDDGSTVAVDAPPSGRSP